MILRGTLRIFAVVFAIVFAFSTSPVIANAEGFDFGSDFSYSSDTGWFDTGDGYYADSAWYDTGDGYYQDSGWYDTGDGYYQDTGWYDTAEGYDLDTGWYDSAEGYDLETGWYDTADGYDVDTGWYDVADGYEPDVYDIEATEYATEEGYFNYSEGSYASMAQHSAPMTITPPRFSFPSYPSYPVQPSRPVYQAPVAHVSQPVFYPTPVSNVNTNTNINNINTCTNGSCNTNIVDNSINNSFNGNTGSFNTGGINASVITVATPQPIVQYQIPQTYPQQSLYCVITVNPTTIANGQAAVLSWSSTGATSAWLNDGIGYVAVNGSLAVRPSVSKSYVLTVNGPAGTNTCTVWVNVTGTQPYVSLTQIPYTGFDFGPIGNAMYWMALLSVAAAGGYLLVYYKGGVLALAGLTASQSNFRSYPALDFVTAAQESIEENPVSTPVETPVEPAPAPANVFDQLPIMENRATRDTMIVKRDGGMPRIVINRS